MTLGFIFETVLIGHEKLTETFKRLVKDSRLSHGYIFFGEPQIGKFSFALALASYLETNKFAVPHRPLSETLVIQADDKGIIGIDLIRELKYFLLQKPVNSNYRVAIINEADRLTSQAQHAILKIAEEPPASSLIILVLTNPEALLPTIPSRLQKIYFPRLNSALIKDFLVKEFNLTAEEAARITELSFGRPGRAIKLTESRKQIRQLAEGIRNKKSLIEELIENHEAMNQYLTELIAELAKDPIKNYQSLKSIIHRLTKMSQFTTNKRLQLESALWNI